MVSKNFVDIKEKYIIKYDNKLLPILLKDHSSKKNITWATNNYAFLRDRYEEIDEITVSHITGKYDDNLNSFIGNPNSTCTETNLVIGGEFKTTETSAINVTNYFKKRFLRFMLSFTKASQHTTLKTYQFVLIQYFTEKSNFDWNKLVTEVDKQLYIKYSLTEDEIAFIELMIKPIE